MGKAVSFKQFQNQIRNCRICKGVIGPPLVYGDQQAEIVQISQAPSQSAIENQRPFSDKSGEKLRKRYYQISDEQFYNPQNFYITALAHCFPGKDKKGADKKPPLICAKIWLLKEILYLKPNIFLVIGRQAGEFQFPGRNYQELIFNDQRLNGTECLVLPHPSPANIAWFKKNPEFEEKRLPEIRRIVHRVLGIA